MIYQEFWLRKETTALLITKISQGKTSSVQVSEFNQNGLLDTLCRPGFGISKEKISRPKLCFRVIGPRIISWKIIFHCPFIHLYFFSIIFYSSFFLVPLFNIFVLFLLILFFNGVSSTSLGTLISQLCLPTSGIQTLIIL